MANKFRKQARHYRPGDQPFLRPLDRNDRARILFLAERLDREGHRKGQHGGAIKRTGIAVLRALLNHFHNRRTGQCDPSAAAIAAAAGVARSTVFAALARLEQVGLIERFQRLRTFREQRTWRTVQDTNAYAFNYPFIERQQQGDLAAPLFFGWAESGNRPGTSPLSYNSPKVIHREGGKCHTAL